MICKTATAGLLQCTPGPPDQSQSTMGYYLLPHSSPAFLLSMNGDSHVDVVGAPYVDVASFNEIDLLWYENRGQELGFTAHQIDAGLSFATELPKTEPSASQIDGDGGTDVAFVEVKIGAASSFIWWYQSMTCPAGRYGVNGSIPCYDCAAGHVGPWVGLGAETGDMCAGPCAPGQYSAAGAMACTNCSAGYMCGLPATTPTAQMVCPPGTYSEGGASACSLCPGGRFGNSSGMTSSVCTGPCPAGYVCSPGTVNGTAALCPPGQFSGEGSSVCSPCPAGRYGGAPPLVHANCTGLCAVGRWGAPGATSADCNGPCAAGYACPPGLNTSNPESLVKCRNGTYSARGQGVCSPCPKGRYGGSAGAESSDCTGACVVGHYCPEGSTEQIPYVAFWACECADCSRLAAGLLSCLHERGMLHKWS
jgi:hypothetical protein